ncbi:hypothetical protein MMC26_002751 [Xylographa opegraphella]|nr:hypothetical protein [Xylographa opegraphella]
MYEEWFEARKHEQYVEDTEAASLQALLSWIISAEEASKRIIMPGPSKSETANLKQWRLWTLVFDATEELPETHPILVNLVREIRKRAEVQFKYGSDTIDWTNTRNFDENWRDTHDSLHAWREKSPEASQKWINFSAFSARVATAKLTALDTVWGFFAIREALEVEGQSQQLLNTDVCAATQWILYAGKAIYMTKNSDMSYWNIGEKTALWRGEPGFSRQRWALWKERFHRVKQLKASSENTKALVRKATDAMDMIETD